MWDILGLLVSFAIIIILIRMGRNFGLSLMLAAFFLAIFSQSFSGIIPILEAFKEAIISADTLSLAFGILFIGVLANIMNETGQVGDIIENLRARTPRGGVIASIPAIFGLLPVPGGVLLSAPMIDEEGDKLAISAPGKAFFNLWFRHIGFLIFPLAPPLLLLSHEAGVAIHWIILFEIPIFIIALGIGIFILWRETKDIENNFEEKLEETIPRSSLLSGISPILITILLFFLLSYPGPLTFYTSLVFSVPAGIATSLLVARDSWKKSINMIKGGFSPDLALAIIGIMAFYRIVESSGIGDALSEIFLGSFLPIPILIVVISFLLGLSMGHNLGAVGLSYSILASTIGANLPLLVLLYTSSFLGYLISPIHLCVAVSFEFFDLDFVDFYKIYIPSAIIVLIAGISYTVILP